MDKRFDTDKYESGYIPFYIERIKNPKRVLEVGVKDGGSLLLWCDLWPCVENVTGVDIKEPLKDLHPKICTLQVDQTDLHTLQKIGSTKGPFDLVVDDASHFGEFSWTTFRALWPYVLPGGVYVVEDWATGYWDSWPDGSKYVERDAPGHTAGMVGMIKRMVDEIEQGDMARLELLPGLAFAYKRS